MKIRRVLWEWARKDVPANTMLPTWLKYFRAILYPIESLQFWASGMHGYQWGTDTYTLYGVRYSGASLRALAKADGGVYRITRDGDMLRIEEVKA